MPEGDHVEEIETPESPVAQYPLGVWVVVAVNVILSVLLGLGMSPYLEYRLAPEERVFRRAYVALSMFTTALPIAVTISLFTYRVSLAFAFQRATFWALLLRAFASIGYSFALYNEPRKSLFAVAEGFLLLLPVTFISWCVWYLMGVEDQQRRKDAA